MNEEIEKLKEKILQLEEKINLYKNYINIDAIEEQNKKLEELKNQLLDKSIIITNLQRIISTLDVKLKIFEQLGNQISSSTELDILLNSLMEMIMDAVKVEAGSLLLLNERTNLLEFKVAKGEKSEIVKKYKVPLGEGIAGWVAQKGIPKIIPEVGFEVTSLDIAKEIEYPTENILCVPIKIKDKIIGVIELINKIGGRRFSKEDLDLLVTLSNQVGLIIENAKLHVEAQEKIKELSTLIGISALINSSLNLKKILIDVMESATVLLNSEASSIFLIDEEKQELYFEVATGEVKEQVKEIRIPIGEGVAGYVARENKSVIVNDVEKDEKFYKKVDETTKFKTKSIIAVPLKIKEKVIGVVEVLNKIDEGGFTKTDLELLEALAHQSAVAIDNAIAHQELKNMFINLSRALAITIEEKDPYTGGHIDRLSYYSSIIAEELNLSEEEKERIYFGALFHDLGKIAISESIIRKEGKLTEEEFNEIKKHPEYGARILEPVKQFRHVITGVLHHHERYDGKGYPQGLKGDEISIDGRIIAVADSFDAMTTDRPYRKALSYEFAIEELKRCAGTQFDPKVVEAFICAYKKGKVKTYANIR
jgi:HD-GYP domain-containing protein (c-di-GMP phosphodiesterase class II)